MKNEHYLSAGVAPGGLYSREEIRLLLCVLAHQLPQPLTAGLAEQVFAQEGLANYFEYHAALQELLASGQLECAAGEGGLVLTLPQSFAHAAMELASALPRRVCDRALHAAERLQEQNRREREHQITVYPTGGGCYMTFRQGESQDMLMSVTVYLPDQEQAQRVRARFLADPGKLFRAVIGALE